MHATSTRWLGKVVNGWLNYYAVPIPELCGFVRRLEWNWLATLRRRWRAVRTTLASSRMR